MRKLKILKQGFFFASPLDLLIIMRMYFLAFFRWLALNRIHNDIAVGVNPYSMEWEIVARKLGTKGLRCVAGDYKSFDCEYPLEMMIAILDHMIQPFYSDGDVNYQVRKILLTSVVRASYLFEDIIFKLIDSLGSGAAGTAFFQTLKNGVMLRMAYVYAHDSDLNKVVDYSQHVSPILFGDDHVINVSDETSDKFNFETIKATMMQEFHQGYTSDRKLEENTPKWRSLPEVTFLKRSFKWCPFLSRHVAPLDLGVVLEIPYWTTKGPEQDAIVISNLDTTISELAIHGQEVYEKWAILIADTSSRVLEYSPPVHPWRIRMRLVSNTDMHF